MTPPVGINAVHGLGMSPARLMVNTGGNVGVAAGVGVLDASVVMSRLSAGDAVAGCVIGAMRA